MSSTGHSVDFVVAANRLPVDRVVHPDGSEEWRTSPGGLVTAMESVMHGRDGVWVGWAGEPGEAPEPFETETGLRLQPVALEAHEVRDYYEGFSNDTLWPIYHDVIVEPTFHRRWWATYRTVNERFAHAIAEVAAEGATVWVHDYQLQLVPALLRDLRPDLRIGWFDHIPFPPVELFAQLPWRKDLLRGLLGADFLGFQRTADARNFVPGLPAAARSDQQGRRRRVGGRRRRPARRRAPAGARCGGAHLDRLRGFWRRWPGPPRCRPGPRRSGPPSATRTRWSSASTGSTTPRASGTACGPSASCSRTATSALPR